MTSLSDRDVILKIRDGEIDYFTLIVKKFTVKIHHFIAGKLFNKNDADDLVQNTFLSFYKAIGRFDEDRPILPYLYQIAKNEMKMFFRRHKQTVSLDDKIMVESDGQLLTDEDVDQRLSVLNYEQKQALSLLSDGFTYQEVAEKLGKPLNTVRTIIRRARIKLKNQL